MNRIALYLILAGCLLLPCRIFAQVGSLTFDQLFIHDGSDHTIRLLLPTSGWPGAGIYDYTLPIPPTGASAGFVQEGSSSNSYLQWDDINKYWKASASPFTLPFTDTASSGSILFSLTQTGTSGAASYSISNSGNSSTILSLSSNGTGKGLTIQETNASNGNNALEVNQAGNGTGVRTYSANGIAMWATTGTLSSPAVYGENTQFGEGVVGRTRSAGNVGAVVGRNDSTGPGVRGFSVQSGIGVSGQAGISGSTGVGGRFENFNSSNISDALQAVTNSAGWAANFTNSKTDGTAHGVRISAGTGGNALTVANGTVVFSNEPGYVSNGTIDDAYLIAPFAGNLTLATGGNLADGTTIWVINNSGGVVTVTNTTAGNFNIAALRAQQFLYFSTISGSNWIPVQ